MDEIKVNDEFMINDDHSYIRGMIYVYDGDKLLFKKENMIVQTGREAIVKSLFNNSNNTNNFQFTGFIMGESRDITTADMGAKEYNATFGNNFIKIDQSSTGVDFVNGDFNESNYVNTSNIRCAFPELGNDLVRNFKIFIPKGTSTSIGLSKISCFGLLCKNGESGSEKLFSRVVFPEYTIKSNTAITIKYYLYF